MSSIEKHDDLESGKSFYYDEAERIFRMIERVGGEVPVLLLIDELLSGTNSLERESASVAILHFLARRNALTVTATHDITIAKRLGGVYPSFYFTDHADDKGLSFDYKIRPGIVQSRNAIKLLSIIGYPEDVIQEAMKEAGET
jgi:DNA mismatch repair ATPase MutS